MKPPGRPPKKSREDVMRSLMVLLKRGLTTEEAAPLLGYSARQLYRIRTFVGLKGQSIGQPEINNHLVSSSDVESVPVAEELIDAGHSNSWRDLGETNSTDIIADTGATA